MAWRTGPRLVLKRAASSVSISFVPGASSPPRIALRSCSRTASQSFGGRNGSTLRVVLRSAWPEPRSVDERQAVVRGGGEIRSGA